MEWLSDFHFIRPLWLLAIIPALLVIAFARSRSSAAGEWQNVIDPQLLPHLIDSYSESQQAPSALWRWLMIIAAIFATLALAGPSWEKLPQPVHKNQDALIIMLDMSLSMGAQDIKPSRYVRATQKITDIIRARRDGQTALIVYAGDAHTVTPLTDDNKTIENLLPALSPFIMPAPGSRPDIAIQLAQQLAFDAGVNKAELLLITDGLQGKDIERIGKALDTAHSHLSLIALGTTDGAPVPLPGSGFLRDSEGSIVLPQLDLQPFRELSNRLGIDWRTMSLDDSDWQTLLNPDLRPQEEEKESSKKFDQWADQGYWLIIPLLILALPLFRRGLLMVAVALLPLSFSDNSYALEWQDLWQTKDQQASKLFESDPRTAAKTFDDPAWAGSAAYRAGDFAQAAEHWSQLEETPENLYNLANAQAMNGQLQEAEARLEEALKKRPDFPEAEENLQRIREAIEQQEKQQQDQQNGDSQNSDQQNSDQQGSDQKNSDQKNSDQKNSDQQNQDSSQPSQNSEQNNDSSQQKDSSADDNSQDSNEQNQSALQQQGEESDEEKTAAQQAEETDEQNEDERQGQTSSPSSLSREEQEAMQQWLNRVPDQPGNLLQRKFLYQYRQNENPPTEDVLW